jgi:hypothetical protein
VKGFFGMTFAPPDCADSIASQPRPRQCGTVSPPQPVETSAARRQEFAGPLLGAVTLPFEFFERLKELGVGPSNLVRITVPTSFFHPRQQGVYGVLDLI